MRDQGRDRSSDAVDAEEVARDRDREDAEAAKHRADMHGAVDQQDNVLSKDRRAFGLDGRYGQIFGKDRVSIDTARKSTVNRYFF